MTTRIRHRHRHRRRRRRRRQSFRRRGTRAVTVEPRTTARVSWRSIAPPVARVTDRDRVLCGCQYEVNADHQGRLNTSQPLATPHHHITN